MKFDTPAATNPIDQMKVVGKPLDRVDGPLKTTGTAAYAYERHDVVPNQAYGYVVGSAIPKGRIDAVHTDAAMALDGVLAIVTALNVPKLGQGQRNTASLFGGPDIQHYHQAVAIVVAESFEQARAAAMLVRIDYTAAAGKFDLAKEAPGAPLTGGGSGEGSGASPVDRVGNFDAAFATAPVTLDATYTTPDESHAMMEPFASIAAWDGDKLTVWTSSQMIAWAKRDLAKTLDIPETDVRIVSPFIGGGFGAKLFLRADAALAAIGARAARRPVKLALKPLI